MMWEFLIAIGAAVVAVVGQVIMFILTRLAAKKDKANGDYESRVTALEEELKETRAALIGILHNELYQNCQDIMARGYITVGELDNLNLIYAPYHNMGGNGTGTKLFEMANSLPLKD